jgi:hypothetical protein
MMANAAKPMQLLAGELEKTPEKACPSVILSTSNPA